MSMTAAQIAERFDGKFNGNGYLISCPAAGHTDKKSSCSIEDGHTQSIVAKCFAGCEWQDIKEGLIAEGCLSPEPAQTGYVSDIDALIASKKYSNKSNVNQNIPAGIFPTNGTGGDLKKLIEWYKYDEGYVARYEGKIDPATNKPIKSFGFYFKKNEVGRVTIGIPTDIGKRSLFNKAKLHNAKEVWFVEGERKVNALGKLGIIATTTSGGAASFDKTDLTPLKGKRIIFWRDNDEAGYKYQESCCEVFDGMGCAVVTIEPEQLGLGHKEDVCDFLKRYPDTTKNDLLKLTWEKPEQFGALPDIDESLIPEEAGIREFVNSISLAFNCERMVPANLLILSICGIIGSRAGLKIWQNQNWVSYPNTFGGVVAPPSFGKSPIMGAALEPLFQLNKKIAEERAEESIRRKVDAELIDIEIAEIKSKIKEAAKGK